MEFGRKLYNLMVARGWTNAETARRAGIPRDAVGVYVNGRAYPQTRNLNALAKAFGLEPEELLPNIVIDAIAEHAPGESGQLTLTRSGHALLKINRVVSVATALKILTLLNADAPDRD
jgi:transcriptional regulator with XRE-family HTH domain